MLGNLVDNACKWARSRVIVSATRCTTRSSITVDDDGPGLDPSMRERVLQRGVRADEAAPGSGLGLAIVRDLAELYGGSIALDGSPIGGLARAPDAAGEPIVPRPRSSLPYGFSSVGPVDDDVNGRGRWRDDQLIDDEALAVARNRRVGGPEQLRDRAPGRAAAALMA